MTVEEIYKDRKKFSKQVFEVASSDLVNMGITVVSYTLKDIRDEEVSWSDDCPLFDYLISNNFTTLDDLNVELTTPTPQHNHIIHHIPIN